MSNKRVFVAGVGIITGLALTTKGNLSGLKAGKHGMKKVSLFQTEVDALVSQVKKTNEELEERAEAYEPVPRTALLGICAARQAMHDAGIDYCSFRDTRIGLISATTTGGMDWSEAFYAQNRRDITKGRLHKIAKHDCGEITDIIAAELYLNEYGNSIITTVSTACSSSANAIMLGARLIRAGVLDIAIVGGTEALCRFTLNGFNSLQIVDKKRCRPFSPDRAGLNLGEGAAYLVLQSEEELSNQPYCEITGYANVNEAFHLTASTPQGDGPYNAMKKAIEMAGIQPNNVSYIRAHGTGTQSNDLAEETAIKRLFGQAHPPFGSSKASVGHTLGASGAIDAVFAALTIKNEKGDEPRELNHVLCNSFGFGGNNTSLLFSKTNVVPSYLNEE